jgi:hypothetical protein
MGQNGKAPQLIGTSTSFGYALNNSTFKKKKKQKKQQHRKNLKLAQQKNLINKRKHNENKQRWL